LSVDASGILSELDEDQQMAASRVEGPLMIVAGPGSGKTRTLTTRIAHLVAECGILPSQCLAITFTRRAAAEMRERLDQLFPVGTDEVSVHTFHSLGLAILREHAEAAGLRAGFRIASESDRLALVEAELEVPPHKAESLIDAISVAKRTATEASPELAEALAMYKQAMTARNWVDFDDLIGLTVQLLTAEPAITTLYRARFRFISVDEFQDVDEQQYRLLSLLAPPGSNICVIGDPDQAIYGFRGADASSFERFRADHPNAKLVRLDRNYRSSGTIVTAAAQVIEPAQSSERVAEYVRDMAERITVHAAPSEVAEAEFVIATIEELIGGHTFFSIDSGRANGGEVNLSFADFAVLYRTRAQADALTEAFARSGVPFKKHEQAPLAEDPALRAVLAELATVESGTTGQPLASALSVATTRARANRDFSPRQIDAAAQRLGALAAASRFDRTRFFDAVAVTSEADFFDPRADRVSLLTMHAAKGLEFPVVFIVGLEDGVMPLYWDHPNPSELEEERRLFYVGMTRAKDRLIMVRALKRLWRGKLRQLPASPFLGDIEAELVKQQMRDLPRKAAADHQLNLF